jgi:uncharacterized OsmC-like protein
MDTATVRYQGDLLTEALHVRSGTRIVTDAPLDNRGRGSAFSPTDLLATSLACCMLTTMGIVASDRGIPFRHAGARVVKHMASGPRRVAGVEVHLDLDGTGLNEEQRHVLEETARTCPVARSLHPDLVQDLHITWRGVMQGV